MHIAILSCAVRRESQYCHVVRMSGLRLNPAVIAHCIISRHPRPGHPRSPLVCIMHSCNLQATRLQIPDWQGTVVATEAWIITIGPASRTVDKPVESQTQLSQLPTGGAGRCTCTRVRSKSTSSLYIGARAAGLWAQGNPGKTSRDSETMFRASR